MGFRSPAYARVLLGILAMVRGSREDLCRNTHCLPGLDGVACPATSKLCDRRACLFYELCDFTAGQTVAVTVNAGV